MKETYSEKTSYISGNGTNKIPLGETGCLSNLYYLVAAQSSLLINPLPLTQSVRPHLVASTSLCSPCVTYGTPCHRP